MPWTQCLWHRQILYTQTWLKIHPEQNALLCVRPSLTSICHLSDFLQQQRTEHACVFVCKTQANIKYYSHSFLSAFFSSKLYISHSELRSYSTKMQFKIILNHKSLPFSVSILSLAFFRVGNDFLLFYFHFCYLFVRLRFSQHEFECEIWFHGVASSFICRCSSSSIIYHMLIRIACAHVNFDLSRLDRYCAFK